MKASLALSASPRARLTAREIEVMTWTARGKTSADCAQILAIKDDTVRAHIENVRVKLQANNKTHAVAIALAHGLISVDTADLPILASLSPLFGE